MATGNVEQIMPKIQYVDYTTNIEITNQDDGVYYAEIDRNTIGIPDATLLFTQFLGAFLSSETISVVRNSSKIVVTARTSRSVLRTIRVFYVPNFI